MTKNIKLQKQVQEGLHNLKTNPEYNEVRKEAILELGHKEIDIIDFVHWLLNERPIVFETLFNISAKKYAKIVRYLPDEIQLATEREADLLNKLDQSPDNNIKAYIMEDGRQVEASPTKIRSEKYAILSQSEWENKGQKYKQMREVLSLSKAEMSRLIGTSAKRISNFEAGFPVLMHKQLEKSYENVIMMKQFQQFATTQSQMLNVAINHTDRALNACDRAIDNTMVYQTKFNEANGLSELLSDFITINGLDDKFTHFMNDENAYASIGK